MTIQNQISISRSSTQQPQLAPTPELKERWKRSVYAARIQWSRLSLSELLETEGDASRLAALVEERYALSREEAYRNVNEFLGTCKGWS